MLLWKQGEGTVALASVGQAVWSCPQLPACSRQGEPTARRENRARSASQEEEKEKAADERVKHFLDKLLHRWGLPSMWGTHTGLNISQAVCQLQSL